METLADGNNLTKPPDSFNDMMDVEPRKSKGAKNVIENNLLLISTLAGVVVGVIFGIILRPLNLSNDSIILISYPGELFMRVLKLLTLPMLISSLITVSSSFNARMSGKIALRTITYFALTSMFSAFLGICIALMMQPGNANISIITGDRELKATSFLDSILDLGRNLFADNLFQATFQQSNTIYVPLKAKGSVDMNNETETIFVRELTHRPAVNTIGIVVFCLAFGTFLSMTDDRGKVVKDFFAAVFEVMLKMVTSIMWTSSIAVASIITEKLLSIDNLLEIFSQLDLFICCVVFGLVCHQLVILPLIYCIFLRKQPYRFLLNLIEPWITAFAVCSSAVTLPTTLHCMIVKMNHDPRISKFVLTLGVNLNTNGAALFLAIAAIFISRLRGAILTYSSLFTILLTTTISSMSIPSIPSSSIVMLLVILTTIDVDTCDVTLLLAVDWLLTTSNVVGDCFAVAVIEKLSKRDLMTIDVDMEQKPESENLLQTV